MAFHMGVLKHLAESGLMERVSKVSSVSGGSLLVGLILHHNGMVWPTSSEYLSKTYPALRKTLCHTNLVRRAFLTLLNPLNWKFLFSRANLLARAMKTEWDIDENLSDLPTVPEISLNGTTAENGKRFRFKRDSMGDYLIGYAKPVSFPLCDAMAMSAAVPGVFGPLVINAKGFSWERLPEWGAAPGSQQKVSAAFDRLHVYDGGVYDNLGIEPLFDCGQLDVKKEAAGHFILVSDAGAVLQSGFNISAYSLNRFRRIAAIQGEQARSLRVRAFWTFVKRAHANGAYLFIAEPAVPFDDAAGKAVFYRTTLIPLSEADCDAIADRGRLVASECRYLAACKRSVEAVTEQ